jgi:hypothetical protein
MILCMVEKGRYRFSKTKQSTRSSCREGRGLEGKSEVQKGSHEPVDLRASRLAILTSSPHDNVVQIPLVKMHNVLRNTVKSIEMGCRSSISLGAYPNYGTSVHSRGQLHTCL